jgi:hypothetical protein
MRMFLDRHGFVEETWFTFSFSPITDESGRVGGVFHPVTEMTSQMLSERRMRTLQNLASRAAKARTSKEAFSLCMNVLAEADLELPFVLLYLVDHTSGLARLVGETGVKGGTPHCPEFVDTRSLGDGHWAIGEAVRTGVAQHVDDVASRLAGSVVGPCQGGSGASYHPAWQRCAGRRGDRRDQSSPAAAGGPGRNASSQLASRMRKTP